MGQITTRPRSVLSHPWVYDLFQTIMGAHRARRNFSKNIIQAHPGSRLLDMGCGTAQILNYLPKDIDYWGYDISPAYITAAKAKFGGKGHFACRFLEESELAAMPPFDIVLAIGLLHHLDDDTTRKMFYLARIALKPGGRFVSLDPVLTADQNFLARLLVNRDRGQHVRNGEGYLALARKEFYFAKGRMRHRLWIPYSHWIMECTRS